MGEKNGRRKKGEWKTGWNEGTEETKMNKSKEGKQDEEKEGKKKAKWRNDGMKENMREIR